MNTVLTNPINALPIAGSERCPNCKSEHNHYRSDQWQKWMIFYCKACDYQWRRSHEHCSICGQQMNTATQSLLGSPIIQTKKNTESYRLASRTHPKQRQGAIDAGPSYASPGPIKHICHNCTK